MQKEPCCTNMLAGGLSAFYFCQRVGSRHHAAQTVPRHMGIDLGGGDVGMTKKRLHAAQIRASFHQMGGKCMTQDVWRNFCRIDTGLERQRLEQLVKAAAGEKTPFAA